MSDLTDRLIAQARRFAESGAAPAEPRLAATVILLRDGRQVRRLRSGSAARFGPRQGARPAGVPGDGQASFEVFLVRRAAAMSFASGMYAFPGGGVDPEDYHGQPVGEQWSARLGRPEPEAQAVVRAAVREVAEETGVRVTAAELLPWTRWITPVFEPRRYDTYFFVAELPAGQQAAGISGEADRTEWVRPAHAIARFESGELAMLPPTSVTLGELAGLDSVDAALAAAATRDAATPILPRVESGPDGADRLVL